MLDSATASSVLGWISIACWIVVYSPQIIENYQLQSGEALSVAFVVVWLLGDLCNLAGAALAHLLPTVIILGAYYTLCDVILLGQIYYYRRRSKGQARASSPRPDVDDGEHAPLLPRAGETAPPPLTRQVVRYVGALVFVVVTGVGAWYVSERLRTVEPAPGEPGQPRRGPEEVLEWKSQLMGWISAVLYLGSRVPQILKNRKTHCAGLSPAMFMFSIAGNSTYALSIVVASHAPRYLIANLSWLAGSALTIFLDVFVLGQFYYYRSHGLVDGGAPAG